MGLHERLMFTVNVGKYTIHGSYGLQEMLIDFIRIHQPEMLGHVRWKMIFHDLFPQKNMKHGNQSTSHQPFQQRTLSLLKPTLDGFVFRLVPKNTHVALLYSSLSPRIFPLWNQQKKSNTLCSYRPFCWKVHASNTVGKLMSRNTAWKKMGRKPFLPPWNRHIPWSLHSSKPTASTHVTNNRPSKPHPRVAFFFRKKKKLFVFFFWKSGKESR